MAAEDGGVFVKRAIIAALLIVPTAGCSMLDKPEIKACERKLVAGLKSPSSYKRVEASTWDDAISLEDLGARYFGPDLLLHERQLFDDLKAKSVAIRHASIQYDADNSYGAAIRDTFYCNFIVADGALYAPGAAFDAKWSEHMDGVVAGKPTVTVKNEYYAEPQAALDPDYDPFASLGIELPPY